MTRADLLNELRVEALDDAVAPYAWSDTYLVSVLSEGQDKFCEETGYFVDLSAYTITTVAGTANYTLPERVIELLDVYDGARKLHNARNGKLPLFDTFESPTPLAFSCDGANDVITLYPTPSTVATLQLRVWRYAKDELLGYSTLDPLRLTDPAVPEIPARFQRACVCYAAHKALLRPDTERFDAASSAKHLQAFNDYCADGARHHRRRSGATVTFSANRSYLVR